MSLCILPQFKGPYGFTITQAVTESWWNYMNDTQQIITVGLGTLHSPEQMSNITLIYSQNTYIQPDIHLLAFQFSTSTLKTFTI